MKKFSVIVMALILTAILGITVNAATMQYEDGTLTVQGVSDNAILLHAAYGQNRVLEDLSISNITNGTHTVSAKNGDKLFLWESVNSMKPLCRAIEVGTYNGELANDKLVVYFSRTGEQYAVGRIDKGNTAIIAEMIAEATGADIFEILPKDDHYPTTSYDDLKEVAQAEKNANARPEIASKIENFDDYDTIFIGYPIWYADMPMILYTFLESYDFNGKTVIPFCTNGGSGLAGTESTIRNKLVGANVKTGLAVSGTTAQNNQSSARTSVRSWLSGLGY